MQHGMPQQHNIHNTTCTLWGDTSAGGASKVQGGKSSRYNGHASHTAIDIRSYILSDSYQIQYRFYSFLRFFFFGCCFSASLRMPAARTASNLICGAHWACTQRSPLIVSCLANCP